jgi:hypothetical protein
MFPSENLYPPAQVCETSGCGATATGTWTATWNGERLCCDACAPWNKTAMPIPYGFAYESLVPVPPAVPHTTGHLTAAGPQPAASGEAS